MAHAVRRQEHAGPDLAERGRLLVDRDPQAVCDQRIGGEQAADAAADNHDMRPGLHHHRLPVDTGRMRWILTRIEAILRSKTPTAGKKWACGWQTQALICRSVAIALVLLALSAPPRSARAEDYPDRTVKIIVPFPGRRNGRCRPAARRRLAVAQMGPARSDREPHRRGRQHRRRTRLSLGPRRLHVASAPPPPLVINHNLYPNLEFDPPQFEPVIVMAHVPNALIVNPDNVKAASVAELIAYLQANPEQGHLRHAGQRHDLASHVRDVSDDGRGEAAARPLSRVGAGACRVWSPAMSI